METQLRLNAITTLSAAIDSFNRAGKSSEKSLLIQKILELTNTL